MENKYPNYWKNDTDKGGKNLFEDDIFKRTNK